MHLVYEALHERAVMWRNAPHLVHPQAFVMPTYSWYELPYYGVGLTLYNVMSGKASLGPTKVMGAKATAARVPNIATAGLKGQRDVSRWAVQRRAAGHGARAAPRRTEAQ